MPTCRALEILDGQLEGPPVVSSPLVNSTVYQMKQTGASYPLAHRHPNKMIQLAESIHTWFGFQGIRIPFDLCVGAEALGCKIKMCGEPPLPYIAQPLQTAFEPFDITADIFDQGRLPFVFQALNDFPKKTTITFRCRRVARHRRLLPVYYRLNEIIKGRIILHICGR